MFSAAKKSKELNVMGFYLNLLIVLPEKGTVRDPKKEDFMGTEESNRSVPTKSYTFWRVESILAIGRTTRMAKITESQYSHIVHGSKERAAICIVDIFFRRITARLRTPSKEQFAPIFSIETGAKEDDFATVSKWKKGNLAYSKMSDGLEFIEPIDSLTTSSLVPSQELMEKHNHVISLPDKKFSSHVKGSQYQVVYDAPLLWETCGALADLIQEAKRERGAHWKALSVNPRSVIYVKLWQEYLKTMDQMGARAILLFDSLPLHSSVSVV